MRVCGGYFVSRACPSASRESERLLKYINRWPRTTTDFSVFSTMSDETTVTIREARREDCQDLIKLSKEIADFHKHFNSPHVDVKVLEKDLFDTPNPNQGFYVAVIDGNVVGYGHYFYTYTLRLGKNMCLQDLYVQEKFRNHKIGDQLMKVIAQKAKEENIGKIEFVVSDWNPAKSFYIKRGAVDLTIKDEFHVYTFSKDAIAKMAST